MDRPLWADLLDNYWARARNLSPYSVHQTAPQRTAPGPQWEELVLTGTLLTPWWQLDPGPGNGPFPCSKAGQGENPGSVYPLKRKSVRAAITLEWSASVGWRGIEHQEPAAPTPALQGHCLGSGREKRGC